MSPRLQLSRALLVLFALATHTRAAQQETQVKPEQREEWRTVEVRSTAASGRSVYIDKGRDDGLEPGDRVRFLPSGASAMNGEVRSVSSTSARVELLGEGQVDVGVVGEARVPAARLEALRDPRAAAEVGDEPAVQHPPWERPPEAWSSEQPLLAPLEEIEPEYRETRFGGRAFAQLDSTQEGEAQGSDSLYARVGSDLRIENPFERGGQLELDAELVRRMTSSADSEVTEDQLRLQRFSYAWGGTRYDPTRLELGRFLQSGFPEFGLLDGVELSRHSDASTYFGVATGLLPEPTFELSTGDDVQLAAFLVRELGQRRQLAWRLGVQKTWHNGAPDRDLIAAASHWRPTEDFDLRGSALVDYYTSGEAVKSAGLELSELHLFGNWRPSKTVGASASYDQVRWPDIARLEFVPLPDTQLASQRFERGSLRVWLQASRDLRLSVRGDLWGRHMGAGERDDGSGGELRADWRDLFWERGRVSLSLFSNEGQYSSIEGLRLGLERDAGSGRIALGYELSSTEQENFLGDQKDLQRQSLRAGWDTRIGDDWSLSLFAEQLFGDTQDALSVGIYLQRRF